MSVTLSPSDQVKNRLIRGGFRDAPTKGSGILADYQRAGRAGRLRASWAQTVFAACRFGKRRLAGSKIATVCTTGAPMSPRGANPTRGVVAKAGLAAIAFVVTAWSKATIFRGAKPSPPRGAGPPRLRNHHRNHRGRCRHGHCRHVLDHQNGDHATRSHDLQNRQSGHGHQNRHEAFGERAVQAPDLESLPT